MYLPSAVSTGILLVIVSITCSRSMPNRFQGNHHWNPFLDSPRFRRNSGEYGIRKELKSSYWIDEAQQTLHEHLQRQLNTHIAKNVIFLVGDGMSMATITAARTHLGQVQRNAALISKFAFEEFPYVGLTKTYCVDNQVADSACTATAYMCGVKSNIDTVGVTATVKRNDCIESNLPENRPQSLITSAQKAGKATGIVTTTAITDATPASAYAHVANRYWECDSDIPTDGMKRRLCLDTATQLIHSEPGRNLNVIFGGGRTKFLPATEMDEDGVPGQRADGVNLIKSWQRNKELTRARYISNKKELQRLNVNETDYVLGLFHSYDMSYNLDADHEKEPSLSEMTATAIKILQKNEEGFVLFIEGGLIDNAHHVSKARKALDETIQFADAVRIATELTSSDDTLIVVTSDHAHSMSVTGMGNRHDDILGLSTDTSDIDNLPHTLISYANGPKLWVHQNGTRLNMTNTDFDDVDLMYPALIPKSSSDHGADDVAVFAMGPWSHLFSGSYEQNVIPHLIGFASCIGNELTACNKLN